MSRDSVHKLWVHARRISHRFLPSEIIPNREYLFHGCNGSEIPENERLVRIHESRCFGRPGCSHQFHFHCNAEDRVITVELRGVGWRYQIQFPLYGIRVSWHTGFTFPPLTMWYEHYDVENLGGTSRYEALQLSHRECQLNLWHSALFEFGTFRKNSYILRLHTTASDIKYSSLHVVRYCGWVQRMQRKPGARQLHWITLINIWVSSRSNPTY